MNKDTKKCHAYITYTLYNIFYSPLFRCCLIGETLGRKWQNTYILALPSFKSLNPPPPLTFTKIEPLLI